ncbi:hypothetical protein [Burkholderia sp. AU31652]|uniref:hypothetical protein n=1 Tax=Burkholderia sp. AU31652 TaxID=2015354 RepID=UPI001177BFB0|nr:hypothetical protein [Burkholderia sp. AU31652]
MVYHLGTAQRIPRVALKQFVTKSRFRPLEAGDQHLYFAFRQTVARLPGSGACVAMPGRRIPFSIL